MFEYPYDVMKESLSMQQAEKDKIYRERDMLLAAFAKFLYELKRDEVRVYRAKHPDTAWEQDWRNIIVVEYLVPSFSPGLVILSQMTWHIHDSELGMFAYLPLREDYKWDGHTTQRKYNRLLEFAAVPLPVILDMTKDFASEGAADE